MFGALQEFGGLLAIGAGLHRKRGPGDEARELGDSINFLERPLDLRVELLPLESRSTCYASEGQNETIRDRSDEQSFGRPDAAGSIEFRGWSGLRAARMAELTRTIPAPAPCAAA